MSESRKRNSGTRPIRRGRNTVSLFANVLPESRETLREIAAATGETQGHVLEQLIAHGAEKLDSSGVPVWWDEPIPAQEQLPLTG